MIRLANVLILDDQPDHGAVLAERLKNGGYHTNVVPHSGGPEFAHQNHPDLVLIVHDQDHDAISGACRIKTDPETSDIPVLLVTDQADALLTERAFTAGADDVLEATCPQDELLARLRPLVRLETMRAELRQRAEAARAFGIEARCRVIAPDDVRPAILLIGDLAQETQSVLSPVGDLVLSATLFEAESLLTQRNFDAALIAFSDEPDGVLGFCSQVRNNPRLFNLPLVLLTDDGTTDPYRMGASRVMPRQPNPHILRLTVMALVRRQQLRWRIRTALNETLSTATSDAHTKVYGRDFFDSYLASRLALAKAHDRHLTVVFFAAPNVEGVRRQFGDTAALHLIQQVGQWITGLLRAEDLTATFAPNEFCVVLPDTPMTEAQVVMHRIAGVLAYTDFAVHDVYQPVKVWVQVDCAEARSDDDVGSLLARARRNIG